MANSRQPYCRGVFGPQPRNLLPALWAFSFTRDLVFLADVPAALHKLMTATRTTGGFILPNTPRQISRIYISQPRLAPDLSRADQCLRVCVIRRDHFVI